MSETATDEELLADIDYLTKTWKHIQEKNPDCAGAYVNIPGSQSPDACAA